MKYTKLDDNNVNQVTEKYIDYYNADGGTWTFEKASNRILQIMTMNESECLVQTSENDEITGFLMGYYKQFDDISAFYLEEIVVFDGFQNKGYGTEIMEHLETVVRSNGAEHIELICVNDERHNRFYNRLGYSSSKTIALMGKHF